MAINENFIFSDPRIQAGVIGIAQIRAAEEAARLQRQAQSQQSYAATQVARDNAAAERARNDAYLTQRERESARQDVTLNKDLDLRRTEEENRRRFLEGRAGAVVTDKEKLARAKAQYDTLSLIAGDATDPPPPTEWATNKARYGPDLSKSELDTLDVEWAKTRKVAEGHRATAGADAASYTARLQAALKTIENDPNGTVRQSRIDALQKNVSDAKQNGYIQFDPVSNSFVSRLAPLRNDPPKGPGAANQEIPEGIRAPQAVAAPPKIESFDSILRDRTPITGGGFMGFDPSPALVLPEIPPEPPRPAYVSPQALELPRSIPAPPSQPGMTPFSPPVFNVPNSGSVVNSFVPQGFTQAPLPSLSYNSPTYPPEVRRWPGVAESVDAYGMPPSQPSRSIPPWLYRPAFSEGGIFGPMGLAGQGIFGQAQAVAAPQFIPPPPFVPQYISTDSPPQPRFVPGYESATQGMNLAPPPFTPPPQMRVPPWLYSPIFGRQGLLGPTGLSGQGVFGTNGLRY